MPRVLNKRTDIIPNGAVYVGRPTKFGNPFVVSVFGTREQVLRRYEHYLKDHPELIAAARCELRGKDLVCWCAPLPCHAEILMKYANK
jgi:hypothetical protein